MLKILIALLLAQIAFTVPLLARLIVEILAQIDLRLRFNMRVPFDWAYVVRNQR